MNLINLPGIFLTLVLLCDASMGGVVEQARSEVFMAKNKTTDTGQTAKLVTSVSTYTKMVNGNSLKNSTINKGISHKYSEDSTWVISDKVNSSDIQKTDNSTFRNSSDNNINNGNNGPNSTAINPGIVKNLFNSTSWIIKSTDRGVTINKLSEGNMWALNQQHANSRSMHRSGNRRQEGDGERGRRRHRGRPISNRDNPDINTKPPNETR